jgi:uncharacterized protein YjiS (DUF1127 family)
VFAKMFLQAGAETGSSPAALGLWDRAANLWRALRNRREVLRLTELDDRALKDIGLLRAEVEGALLEPFHTDPSKVLSVRRVEHRGGVRAEAVRSVAPAEKEIRFAPRHACCV